MKTLRKLATCQVPSAAQLAEWVLVTLGILGLLVGLLIMPSLGLTPGESYAGLLALVGFMVVCFGAGQLAVLRERLSALEADRRVGSPESRT